jgi:hypothetical protein
VPLAARLWDVLRVMSIQKEMLPFVAMAMPVARLDFDEDVVEFKTLRGGEACECFPLRLDPKPRSALL